MFLHHFIFCTPWGQKRAKSFEKNDRACNNSSTGHLLLKKTGAKTSQADIYQKTIILGALRSLCGTYLFLDYESSPLGQHVGFLNQAEIYQKTIILVSYSRLRFIRKNNHFGNLYPGFSVEPKHRFSKQEIQSGQYF